MSIANSEELNSYFSISRFKFKIVITLKNKLTIPLNIQKTSNHSFS